MWFNWFFVIKINIYKKMAKKIFVYEKSKSNVLKIKKLKLPCEVTSDFKKIIPNLDLIIFCTPLGEYKKIILKINKYLLPKTIITDVGSSKEKSIELIRKKLKKGIFWTLILITDIKSVVLSMEQKIYFSKNGAY